MSEIPDHIIRDHLDEWEYYESDNRRTYYFLKDCFDVFVRCALDDEKKEWYYYVYNRKTGGLGRKIVNNDYDSIMERANKAKYVYEIQGGQNLCHCQLCGNYIGNWFVNNIETHFEEKHFNALMVKSTNKNT